jgi:hypothetical protein
MNQPSGRTVMHPRAHIAPPITVDAATLAGAHERLVRARASPCAGLWNASPPPCGIRALVPGSRLLVQEEPAALDGAWVIGDLHGDAVAASVVTEHVHRLLSRGDIVVFLGDLVDDLPESLEVLAIVDEFRGQHPGRTLVLRGNHDAAITVGPDGSPRSSVSPSTFVDRLESLRTGPERTAGILAAQRFASFMAEAPCALFLRDGTIFAHGGVPHVDLQVGITCADTLSRAASMGDFEWSRLVQRVKRRVPIPLCETRSRELGAADFIGFLEVASRVVGFRMERMVRGHCHSPSRAELHGGPWEDRVLTINSMAWVLPREIEPDGPATPVVARWEPWTPCRAIPLTIDEDWNRSRRPHPVEPRP